MNNYQTSTKSLEKLHEEITKHTTNGPKNCGQEESRIEYLENALISHSWAKQACSRAAVYQISYQKFFRQLKVSMRQN